MCPEFCESSWQAYERVEDPWTVDEKLTITCGKVIMDNGDYDYGNVKIAQKRTYSFYLYFIIS